MLQRQILFKQLHEMQHQQQLQELTDARRHSFVTQLPFINKQTSAGLQQPLIDGMPVHDASQMFMVNNMHQTQHGTSPFIQGAPNGLIFSQAQNQVIGSNVVQPQQFDPSLYGTPIASPGSNMNPYSFIQGLSHDSASMLNRVNNSQLEIPVMQSSTVSNSFVNEQFNASPGNACISDGMFVPKNVAEDKNMLGQLLMHASADGAIPANFQQLNSLQMNPAMKESGVRQQQAGWHVFSAKKTSNLCPWQSATSLDPLEEKILFDTDDNSWESSLGRKSNVGLAGFDSNGEHADIVGVFSSNHSGKWSALMQSAVAEASSSDTGQQEEWSGLTFQNPELSADDQHTNYTGDGRQSSWVDNNLQSNSSPTSEPEIPFENSNTNCSFPTFQQSHNLVRPKERIHSDSSHDSVKQSPKSASNWSERNLQHKQTVEECQLVQTPNHLQNACHDQRSENSKNNRRQLTPYALGGQSGTDPVGGELKANVWLHESGSQPLFDGSQRPPDQAPYSCINQEPGCVDNIYNSGISSQKVLSADFQTSSRASQELPPRDNVDSIAAFFDDSAGFSGQRNNLSGSSNFYNNSSDAQGFGLRSAAPSQQGRPVVANASGSFYLNNQLKDQYQPVTPVASQSLRAELPAFTGVFQPSITNSGDASGLLQTNIQDQEFPTLESLPVTRPYSTSSVPQQIQLAMGPPNMSQDGPSQPDMLQADILSVFSNPLPSPDSTNSNAGTSRGTPHQQFKQITFGNGDNVKETNTCLQKTQVDDSEYRVDQLNSSRVSTSFTHNTLDQGHKAVVKHLAGANSRTSVPMKTAKYHQAFHREDQRDNNTPNVPGGEIDAFVGSLRPHDLQQNSTLLHQVNANAREQFYGHKAGLTNLALGDSNSSSQLNPVSSWVNNIMTCSSEASENQPGKPSSKAFIQDSKMLVFGENGTRSHFKEHSQINMQMAPPWFEHNGSMKNGQIISMYQLMCQKEAAKQFAFGQVNSSVASSILPNSATHIGTAKQLSPPIFVPSDETGQSLAVSTPKKRKLAAVALLPWHKEVTQVPQQLQKDSSMTESEWALASNRLSEKMEDEAEMMEDVVPTSRAKKRLVLTTQLMQQVFRPAPAVILSADAHSNSESMMYFVTRLALGDACSMASGFEMPPLTSDMSSNNLRISERVGQLDFSEVAENFVGRAKKLGNELSRLEKTLSIVDMKVDFQELERFSVINRFAKFHSRVHNASINTPSTSGANPAVHKTHPQKFVVGHPMPNVVPEGVSCISL